MADIAQIDRWLQANTFHHGQFADVAELVRRKQERNLTISLCIPTFNEAETISRVVTPLRSELQLRLPLLDEIAVIDSGSTDRTREHAAAAGAEVYLASEILPEMGNSCGKGENLWKAVYQLKGDILVFVDGDIRNMHPRFVTGLVGPLLRQPEIGYVKSFADRSAEEGGGRVTEILIRPFFALFFPELAGIIQPLSGEFAARRVILEQLPFPVGYGVETAHILDIFASHGLESLAQTDLGPRQHRCRTNLELGKMAFAILQVAARRLQQQRLLSELSMFPRILRQFHLEEDAYRQELSSIDEQERPPMRDLPAYQQVWRERQRGR